MLSVFEKRFRFVPEEWGEEFERETITQYELESDCLEDLPSNHIIQERMVYYSYYVTSFKQYNDRLAYLKMTEDESEGFYEWANIYYVDDFVLDVHKVMVELNLAFYSDFRYEYVHFPLREVW